MAILNLPLATFLAILTECAAAEISSEPWGLTESATPEYGLAAKYTNSKLSSIELKGILDPDDHVYAARGLYSPLDRNSDGIVDLHDHRPVYVQLEERIAQPGVQTVRTGKVIAGHYMYYLNDERGWAVGQSVGSHTVVLFHRSAASTAQRPEQFSHIL